MAGGDVHELLKALLSTDNDIRSKAEVKSSFCDKVITPGEKSYLKYLISALHVLRVKSKN